TGDSIRHLFNTVENQAVGPAGEVAESGKAQVRIAGATASEDAGSVTLAVTLNRASEYRLSVGYRTQGVSGGDAAAAGSDYSAASGTLVFAPGETSQQITVPVLDDNTYERDERFAVELHAASNFLDIATGAAGVTITEDDAQPTLTMADVNAGETAATVGFTAELDRPSKFQIAFGYTTAAGSAEAGADYTSASGTVAIAPGDTSAGISVQLSDDSWHEGDETFHLDLSDESEVALGTTRATATLADDETAPLLSASNGGVTNPVGVEGDTLTFVVSMTPAKEAPVTVSYATQQDTADGGDYTPASGTATFQPGDTEVSIPVVTTDDNRDEPTQAFRLLLSGASGAGLADANAIGTIQDNDATPTLTVNNASISEGGTLSFPVSLSGVSERSVSVAFATAHVSTENGDYAGRSSTLTFTPGQTSGAITVATSDDNTYEGNEALRLDLSGVQHASLARTSATGTILEDDPKPSFRVENAPNRYENQGAAYFPVTLNRTAEANVCARLSTQNGSAANGSDYYGRDTTLCFSPGQTSKTFQVNFRNDGSHEGNQYFYLKATNLSGNATMGRSRGSTYILNDDPNYSSCGATTVYWGGWCRDYISGGSHGSTRTVVDPLRNSRKSDYYGGGSCVCNDGSWSCGGACNRWID
ncbi:hypothetical protein CKO28_00005, partial [Rhodovibrio sodomensis]